MSLRLSLRPLPFASQLSQLHTAGLFIWPRMVSSYIKQSKHSELQWSMSRVKQQGWSCADVLDGTVAQYQHLNCAACAFSACPVDKIRDDRGTYSTV